MYRDRLPPVPLPTELSDEAVAKLLEVLYEFTTAIENHYAAQLHRYYNPPRDDQLQLWQDPPF